MISLRPRRSRTAEFSERVEMALKRLRRESEPMDMRTKAAQRGQALVDTGAETARALLQGARVLADRAVELGQGAGQAAGQAARDASQSARDASHAALDAGQAARVAAADVAARVPVRVEVGEKARRPIMPLVVVGVVVAAVGAVIAYLMDPALGRTRRAQMRDQVAGGARKVARATARQTRYLASTASGMAQRVQKGESGTAPLDEVALAHRVETELFRDPDIDKGTININAERDVVFLRGTAPTEDRITSIEARVREVEGVRHVVNLLHLPGDSPRIEPERGEIVGTQPEGTKSSASGDTPTYGSTVH